MKYICDDISQKSTLIFVSSHWYHRTILYTPKGIQIGTSAKMYTQFLIGLN